MMIKQNPCPVPSCLACNVAETEDAISTASSLVAPRKRKQMTRMRFLLRNEGTFGRSGDIAYQDPTTPLTADQSMGERDPLSHVKTHPTPWSSTPSAQQHTTLKASYHTGCALSLRARGAGECGMGASVALVIPMQVPGPGRPRLRFVMIRGCGGGAKRMWRSRPVFVGYVYILSQPYARCG